MGKTSKTRGMPSTTPDAGRPFDMLSASCASTDTAAATARVGAQLRAGLDAKARVKLIILHYTSAHSAEQVLQAARGWGIGDDTTWFAARRHAEAC